MYSPGGAPTRRACPTGGSDVDIVLYYITYIMHIDRWQRCKHFIVLYYTYCTHRYNAARRPDGWERCESRNVPEICVLHSKRGSQTDAQRPPVRACPTHVFCVQTGAFYAGMRIDPQRPVRHYIILYYIVLYYIRRAELDAPRRPGGRERCRCVSNLRAARALSCGSFDRDQTRNKPMRRTRAPHWFVSRVSREGREAGSMPTVRAHSRQNTLQPLPV